MNPSQPLQLEPICESSYECMKAIHTNGLRVRQHFLFLIEEGMLSSQVPIQEQEWGAQEEGSN